MRRWRRVLEGGAVLLRGDESRDVRNVRHQERAHRVRRLAHPLIVPNRVKGERGHMVIKKRQLTKVI